MFCCIRSLPLAALRAMSSKGAFMSSATQPVQVPSSVVTMYLVQACPSISLVSEVFFTSASDFSLSSSIVMFFLRCFMAVFLPSLSVISMY